MLLLCQLPAASTCLSTPPRRARDHTQGGGSDGDVDRGSDVCVNMCVCAGKRRGVVSERWRDYSLSSKELHAQQSEDHDEEEEEEEQADDGLHGIQEGDHEVPQRVPISERKRQTQRETAMTLFK